MREGSAALFCHGYACFRHFRRISKKAADRLTNEYAESRAKRVAAWRLLANSQGGLPSSGTTSRQKALRSVSRVEQKRDHEDFGGIALCDPCRLRRERDSQSPCVRSGGWRTSIQRGGKDVLRHVAGGCDVHSIPMESGDGDGPSRLPRAVSRHAARYGTGRGRARCNASSRHLREVF